MPRRPRVSWAGGIFHVMNRGVDRQPVFFGDDDRLDAGRLLAEVHEQFGVETLAYCLMTNHFHLVLRLDGDDLSAAMHHFGSTLARRVNDRTGRDGPLFRGRFLSLPVETDAYLQWVVRYVHRNALDLPGVTSVLDHRWSSMRTYVGLRPAPAFVNLEPVLASWSTPDEFVRFHESPEGARLLSASSVAVEAVIRHHVAEALLFAASDDDPIRGVGGTVRAVLALLSSRIDDAGIDELVERSFRSRQALYGARHRAEARLGDDAQLRSIVERVFGSLPADLPKCA